MAPELEAVKAISNDKRVLYFTSLVVVVYLGLQIYKAIQEIHLNKQTRQLNDLEISGLSK